MKTIKKFLALAFVVFPMTLILISCSDSSTNSNPTNNTNEQKTTIYVYVTATGSVYHKSSGAHGYKTSAISLENAKVQGCTACKNGCY